MPNVDHLRQLKRVVYEQIAADSPLDMSTFWHPCGTFGCLAGWAAHDDYFRSKGLQVMPGKYGGNYFGVLVLWLKKEGAPHAMQDFKALEHFFELDAYQACYLFGNNPDATGHDAIVDWHDALARINEVISGEV